MCSRVCSTLVGPTDQVLLPQDSNHLRLHSLLRYDFTTLLPYYFHCCAAFLLSHFPHDLTTYQLGGEGESRNVARRAGEADAKLEHAVGGEVSTVISVESVVYRR